MTGLAEIVAGGKPALARALSRIEADRFGDLTIDLLDDAFAAPKAGVLGLTGPPGVGKSTLTRALIGALRARGETVGVIAVDPSSQVTGGSLLGDRTRLKTDPQDTGVYVRSMAAGDRLGGLSDATIAATVLMRAVFDRVIVESVGVGQSEGDIGLVSDATLLCIQPGSGDSLQFMKAGIMELPDIIAVTKADAGAAARRAVADVEGALSLSGRTVPVLAVSAVTGEGVDALLEKAANLAAPGDWRARPPRWLAHSVRATFGAAGLAALAKSRPEADPRRPFATERTILDRFAARWNIAES